MKLSVTLLFSALIFQAAALCQFGISLPKTAETKVLTISEIDPTFGPIASVFEEDEIIIEYVQIDDSNFDEFFFKSAKVNGLISIGNSYSEKTSSSLKNTAKDIAASNNINVKEVVGEKPESEWTPEDHVAIIRLNNKQKEVDSDVTKGYLESSKNLLLVVSAVNSSVTTIPDLIKSGTSLKDKVSSLEKTLIPAAGDGIVTSLSNLQSAGTQAPDLVKNLTILAQALQMFAEN